MRSAEAKERIKALRRECTKVGIRYTNRIASIQKLEEMLSDPYPHILETWRRYWNIEPFDFRGKGIVPKKNAWVKWVPKSRYDRETVRGVGRFVEDNLDGTVTVKYPMWLGSGYRDKHIRISPFQIIDYREDR